MEPPPFVNVHFFDLARRAGHAEAEARALQAQVVGVTGASEKRAAELLLMADFDINRAAEYHFTHPEDVQEAEVSEVSDTTGLQQVQVQATAPAGQTMTVLVPGRGEFSAVVPEGIAPGEPFRIALPALSLQSLDAPAAEVLVVNVRRPPSGFGVKLYHSKNRQVVEVDEVEDGSPAHEAGFLVRDVVIELAGVQVEGRVPHGLKEAMIRVKELTAQGQDTFEWKLRRKQQQQQKQPSPAVGGTAAAPPASPQAAADGPTIVSASARSVSWGEDEDEDTVLPGARSSFSAESPSGKAAEAAGGEGGGAAGSPTLSEAELEAVQQLVDAGAAALNSAADATGFQRAMLKFDSALQLNPCCEEARYGKAQALKALDLSVMAAGPPSEADGRGPAMAGASVSSAESPREGGYRLTGAERTQPGVLPIFRVVSGAVVRQGRETSSGLVRELEPGTEVEVLEMALDSARRVRLRGTEGWLSVQAANGQLLLEECFHPSSTPQVCQGEKKVYECEVALRRPCGFETQVGTAEITTKRLRWTPSRRMEASTTDVPDWREAAVTIPLQRIIAFREKGGGLGLGALHGFELVFDTGPSWWFKEGARPFVPRLAPPLDRVVQRSQQAADHRWREEGGQHEKALVAELEALRFRRVLPSSPHPG